MNDKDFHFIVGFGIYTLAWFTPVPPFIVVILVAAGKEIYDWATGQGLVEVADFAFTCFGGLVAAAVMATGAALK